jgi:hypothetical protein
MSRTEKNPAFEQPKINNEFPDMSKEYRQKVRISSRRDGVIILIVNAIFGIGLALCILYCCTK